MKKRPLGVYSIWCLMAACSSGASPSPVPPSSGPAGWVYFTSAADMYAPPARVNVRTKQTELVTFPPPIAAVPDYILFDGMIAPLNGAVTGQARLVGSSFPETFMYDPRSNAVYAYRDPNDHVLNAGATLSPDGGYLAVLRRWWNGLGTRNLVVIHLATGRVDTILGHPHAERVSRMFWVGTDTVVYYASANGPEAPYRSISRSTGASAPWTVVPWGDYVDPVFSMDRRWIAHWFREDFTPIGEGGTGEWVLRLRVVDRSTGAMHLLREGPSPTTGWLSRAFDPTSRYLAYCRDQTTIVIHELATHRDLEELQVGYCFGISWSWGPEGPPPGQ